MSIKKKLFVSAVATVVVAASMSVGAYAATTYNLFINGKKANSEIIVKNGTTYVPLRLVSESLGAKVSFDGKNINVNTSSSSTSTSESSKPSTTNSRSNPAAIGVSLPYQVNDIMDNYSGKVSILTVKRGAEANRMITQANPFNEEPKEGYEYILAKAKITVDKNKSEGSVDLSFVKYKLISSSGVEYDNVIVVEPDPSYGTSVYAGAEHVGWIAFQVKKDDANPLIVFNRSYDGTGGVWFKTK